MPFSTVTQEGADPGATARYADLFGGMDSACGKRQTKN
jgi:hypothetical protein